MHLQKVGLCLTVRDLYLFKTSKVSPGGAFGQKRLNHFLLLLSFTVLVVFTIITIDTIITITCTITSIVTVITIIAY